MVFRTGLLGTTDAADIGVPASRWASCTARGARPAGRWARRVRLGAKVAAIEPAGRRRVPLRLARRTAGELTPPTRSSWPSPHEKAAPLMPPGAAAGQTARAGPGWALAHRQRARDLRPPVMDLPFVAAVGSPVQWVFDRTRISGMDRPGPPVPGDLAVGRGPVRGHPGGRAAGAVRARAGRAVPGRARAPRSPSSSSPANGGRRSARRRAAARCGPKAATRRPGLVLAGAWTDTGWPDTMEGAVRSGLAAAVAAAPDRPGTRLNDWGTSVTAVMPEGVALARDLVGPAMEAAIARLTPDVRAVAAYHLGFADAAGNPIRSGSGKALRPALALLSARAAGAPPERGVTAAVAVELVHNFSLLHDDIMDSDTERRHRPTAWTVFGVGRPSWPATRCSRWPRTCCSRTTRSGRLGGPLPAAAVLRLIGGQGADLAFERRDDVTLAECLDMAGDKTAALLACACSIGAVHLGAPPTLAMALAGFGAHVGLAFQLTDDVLGIWGAPEVTGKPVRADLRARKKSLPVVAALNSGQPEAAELRALLGQPGAADRGRPGPRGRPDRGGGRQGLGRGRGRRPAGRGQRQPGRHRPGRRRAGRADRHRRVHHGPHMVAGRLARRNGLARGTLDRARDHLLGLQDADGWWKGELETNVTMDAEDLLLREFLGLRDRRRDRGGGAAGSAPSSGTDGTWANFYGGPATSPPRSRPTWRCGWPATSRATPHMKLARDWSPAQGGVEATRVFTRIWLALFGLWSWDDLPVMPPELISCRPGSRSTSTTGAAGPGRRSSPLDRGPVVRPVRPSALHRRAEDRRPARPRPPPAPRPSTRDPSAARRLHGPWTRLLHALDRPCSLYRPVKPRPARRRCGARRVDHRPAGGGRLLGRHPAAVGVLADGAAPARLPARPPGDAKGLAGLERFTITEDDPTAGAPARGLPVAGLGHRAGDDRARRRRPRPPTTRRCARRRLAARRGDPRPGRLGGAPAATSRRAAGRSSSPTTTTPTSTTPPRSCWRCAGSSRDPTPAPPSTAALRLAGRDAVQGRRLGRVRRRQHPQARSTSCRSATSARSSTRRSPTSPRTSSRCSPPRAGPPSRPRAAGWPGCCARRSRTAPGSAAGAPTTSTAPAPSCPR